MPTTIVLADDHPIVRRGMRALLEAEADFSIVGESGDGRELVTLVQQLEPDVVVLDLILPGLSGLDAMRLIRQNSPRIRVVVLSMYNNNAFVATALKEGAMGYVLKGGEAENLVRAIRDALAGKRYLCPPVTELAIEAYIEQSRSVQIDLHETLTDREREVLQLTAEGNAAAEVASRLHISQRTVENHRANFMRKLGLKNQIDLVRYALRRGLISLEE
jgi:two-component system response regulator NreC